MQKLESQLSLGKYPQRSVPRAWKRCLDTALELDRTACSEPMPMTCVPPCPAEIFAFAP